MKKYELTDETLKIGPITLHRVKSLVAFTGVEVGETGGWVEKEANLEQNGDAWVCGNAKVYGNAKVSGDAWVYGNAKVYGDALVCGNAKVYGDAWVCGNKHYMVIGPIGSRDDSITFTRDKKGGIFATVGCFFGTLAEFRAKVSKTHGDNIHAQAYLLAAQLAELRIDTTPISDTQKEPTEGCEKGSAE